jgi:hypothetical protein
MLVLVLHDGGTVHKHDDGAISHAGKTMYMVATAGRNVFRLHDTCKSASCVMDIRPFSPCLLDGEVTVQARRFVYKARLRRSTPTQHMIA